MKIGLVRRGFSASGGAEAYLRRFADAAAGAGHECVLFTGSEWPDSAWPHEMQRVAGRSPLAFADELRAYEPRRFCDLLFSLERVGSCDVYRAGDGVHASWLRRRKAFEPAWKLWFRRFSWKHREILQLERHLFGPGGARLVIANSRLVQREIETEFAYPPEQIRVIYNGLPAFTTAPDARVEVRNQLGLSEDEYVLLFAGSGWERKGLRYAIDAVERSGKRPTLLVAGRGRTRGLPGSDRVRFLGPVGDLPRYLAAADAFLLPTMYEPFSNACLEAAAAGLPVITTVHNGFAEVLEPGVNGEAVSDPRDIEALARAIDAWADPVRRAAVRPQLQALGASHSIERNLQETLSALSEIS